ncbi:hypothetical protein RSM1_17770, partial [Methylobacterium radiotolerans]
MTLRDGLAALLVVTLLGVNFVAIKVGLVTVPPLMLCALRFGFAALPAALVIRPPERHRRDAEERDSAADHLEHPRARQ